MTADKAPRSWWIEDNGANRTVPAEQAKHRYIEVISLADYDALAAELRIQDQANEILTRQLAETKAELEQVKLERDAYRNQSPEDYLTPYENELLGDLKLLQSELSREKKKVEKLREIRRHHAWHNEDCAYEPDPCTCGFDKRIAELEAINKESEGAR